MESESTVSDMSMYIHQAVLTMAAPMMQPKNENVLPDRRTLTA